MLKLVEEVPVVWVICDQTGNWKRLQNKLKLNNLSGKHLHKVPANSTAAAESVREQIAALEADGMAPGFKLDKPMTYTALMNNLESLGLVEALPPIAKKARMDKEPVMSSAHRENVFISLKKIKLLITLKPRLRIMFSRMIEKIFTQPQSFPQALLTHCTLLSLHP